MLRGKTKNQNIKVNEIEQIVLLGHIMVAHGVPDTNRKQFIIQERRKEWKNCRDIIREKQQNIPFIYQTKRKECY